MRKIISTLLSLAIVIGTLPMMIAMADEQTAGEYTGSGTESDPYLISNAAQLKKMRDDVNADSDDSTGKAKAFYRLTADIDLENNEWTPIGLSDNFGFRGTFDGDGHVVKNFKITDTSRSNFNKVGFFGGVLNPTIKNFGIENANISVTGCTAGGMIGRGGVTLVENCFVKKSIIRSENSIACGFNGSTRTKSEYRNCYVYDCATYGSTRIAFSYIENFNEHIGGDVFTNCYVEDIQEAKRAFLLGGHSTNEYCCDTTETPTVTNCFSNIKTENPPGTVTSTASGKKAEHTHNQLVAGIYGATKEGIAAAMVNSGAYMVSDTINEGYPHLNFENPSAIKAWDGVKTEKYSGTGTENDPYLIENAAQLAKFSAVVNGSRNDYTGSDIYVQLTSDIDLGGKEWTPIGYQSNADYYFGGTFDGNGHIVKNFKVSVKLAHGGLFGYTNATIKKLGVENVTINNDGGYNGAIAGKGTLKIYDCYVKNANVSAKAGRAGGLVGALRGASVIENCYTDGVTVSGTQNKQVGCLVGQAENYNEKGHTFKNCYTANAIGVNSVIDIENTKPKDSDTDKTKTYFSEYWTVENVFTTGTNMTNNIGETKTVAEILSVLTATGKYKSGNSELPVLAWETVEDLSDVNPYVVAAVSANADKTVNVTLVENKAVTGTLYIVSYDTQGRFVTMDEFDAETAKTTVKTTNVKSDAPIIKVFVWDASQKPISKAYTK